MKREYNEVYGWMPDSVINHLSQADRMCLFLDWINREPTDTGWLITMVVVNSLGKDFMRYILDCAIESVEVDGEDIVTDEENYESPLQPYLPEGVFIPEKYFFNFDTRECKSISDFIN